DDSAPILEERRQLANAREERTRLALERFVPLREADHLWRSEEAEEVSKRIADEDVKLPKLLLNACSHGRDIFGSRHVGLHGQCSSAELFDRLDRSPGGRFITYVVDGDGSAPL